jgi:AcrR family transcriptional regulator
MEMVKAVRSDGIRSRHTILDTAARLATVEGLDGLSIGRLAEHIGMSKSGLYAHFKSKEELQLATIETALDIFRLEVVDPAARCVDPVEHLVALCDLFLSHLERRVFPGGCFFVAVAAEFDTHSGPIKDAIMTTQDAWMSGLTSLIESGQAQGRLDPELDAQQVAFELDAFLLLANMAFVMKDDVAALRRGAAAYRARLGLASDYVVPGLF